MRGESYESENFCPHLLPTTLTAMNQAEHISIKGRHLLDRRNFMRSTGMTFGGLGLAQLLAVGREGRTSVAKSSLRPQIDPDQSVCATQAAFPDAGEEGAGYLLPRGGEPC